MNWCHASSKAWLAAVAALVATAGCAGPRPLFSRKGPAAETAFNVSLGEPHAVAFVSVDLAASGKAKEGEDKPGPSDIEQIDHVAVRWFARTTGGAAEPQFITARELAFEARIESLTEASTNGSPIPYAGKHVRAAIQRHVTEEILSQLPVRPVPTERQIKTYAMAARRILVEQLGGDDAPLKQAAAAEGIELFELDDILIRRAKASWYLDKMVAPMLSPSDLDLREAHRAGETPFTSQPFDDVSEKVQRWYVATKLASALDRYYRGVRSRVQLKLIRH